MSYIADCVTSCADALAITPRIAREAAGYGGVAGLERLAKKVRRSVDWLRKVEQGYRPPEQIAARLAGALRCSVDVFCVGAPRRPSERKLDRLNGGRAYRVHQAKIKADRATRRDAEPLGRPAPGEKYPAPPSSRRRGGVATAPTSDFFPAPQKERAKKVTTPS